MLDTRRELETPEGVELGLPVAGPVVRSLAWGIDFVIRGVIYIGLLMVLPFLGRFGVGLFFIALFSLEWFYPVLYEVYQQGSTPGKKTLGIRVIHDDGTPIGWAASLVRNLLRSVDFLPLFYGFGLLSMLINRDFKRLGDMTAGTLVVYGDDSLDAPCIPEAAPIALPVPLNSSEQRAVFHFAERAHKLTPQRLAELSEILTPLTGTSGAEGTARLYQYANWLVGRR